MFCHKSFRKDPPIDTGYTSFWISVSTSERETLEIYSRNVLPRSVKSSALFLSTESLIVRYWLKHFLPTNSVAQSPADEKRNAIGQQKMLQPIAYD